MWLIIIVETFTASYILREFCYGKQWSFKSTLRLYAGINLRLSRSFFPRFFRSREVPTHVGLTVALSMPRPGLLVYYKAIKCGGKAIKCGNIEIADLRPVPTSGKP